MVGNHIGTTHFCDDDISIEDSRSKIYWDPEVTLHIFSLLIFKTLLFATKDDIYSSNKLCDFLSAEKPIRKSLKKAKKNTNFSFAFTPTYPLVKTVFSSHMSTYKN